MIDIIRATLNTVDNNEISAFVPFLLLSKNPAADKRKFIRMVKELPKMVIMKINN